MDEPGKQGGCLGVGGQLPAGGVLGKSVLCRGPQYVVDDRGMLAGVGLAVVRDPSNVERVRQQLIEVAPSEGPATAFFAVQPPPQGGDATPIDFLLQTPNRAEISI